MQCIKKQPSNRTDGHRGFLYIRCPKCGKEMGFCPKEPITQAICYQCGERFKLPQTMTLLSFWCECGKHWKYLTNITDKMFDIRCIACGTPNAVIINHKSEKYVKAK